MTPPPPPPTTPHPPPPPHLQTADYDMLVAAWTTPAEHEPAEASYLRRNLVRPIVDTPQALRNLVEVRRLGQGGFSHDTLRMGVTTRCGARQPRRASAPTLPRS